MPAFSSSFTTRLATLLLLFIFAGCQPSGNSQESAKQYPTRPISYFVPWNAGGGTDTISRALAAVMPEYLDASVNVINRSGGGGVVGHLALANAKADGYTIGAITGEITMMHWQGLTPLTVADYTPLALLTNNPGAITVHADAPWNTLDELIAAIKANPGTLFASGTSRGGIWDLARIGFLDEAGLSTTDLPWVPSQGAAPALQELIAGGVQVVTVALAETEALYRAGQVKVLGVMSDKRLDAFPEIPTLKEQGINWQIGGWMVIGAPKGITPEVKTTLLDAVKSAVNDSSYSAPLKKAGFNLTYLDGQELESFMASQNEINGKLLQMAGLAR